MGNVRLSDIFHITERFQRSVHLERDFYTENALDGYIVTVKARETLTRLISAQENGATSKAWSLTGPYGSGKSAFALFAAKLLGDPGAITTQQALDMLRRGDNSLYERFMRINDNGRRSASGFCPVLISGERAPITLALLQGLEHGITAFNGMSPRSSLRRKIKNLSKAAEHGEMPSASEITQLFESATQYVAEHGGTGLLLVIDELGKFLEYAAQSPAQGDVFVLQTLAEFATRSTQTPLFLLTILHQAFEQYAHRLAKSQREEWAKVQGRFEDIAFVEPAEQILRLIASAIQDESAREREGLSVSIDSIESDLKPIQLNDDEFSGLLRDCLPLHPTVALIIGPIFRRFAQNERSLFAFLSSSEPYGLQDFLSSQHYDGSVLPMLSIADLYDYLNTTIANRLYASRDGDKWVEIEMAINRLTDPSPTLVKLIKTIGLLSIIGEVNTNLKASERILRYALNDHTAEFDQEFDTALKTLEKRSIVIYRRYNDVYALWEGSDIDIEALSYEAEGHLDPNETLTNYLSKLAPPRPLIARRHLFEKGTLRYFEVRYTDLENFDANLSEPSSDADGLVLYALPAGEDEVNQFIEKVNGKDTTEHQNVLIGIPHSTRFLRDAATELACLHWISENTPELEGDAVARRELSIRWVAAERDVADQLTKIFGGDSDEPCKWFHKGQEIDIDSQRARNAYLSKICDEVYHKTPLIQNELINRRKISATITTARKKLIQAILENGDQENLGITGYPAEMSIYRSLLQNTGIHREVDGVCGFHPPKPDDKNEMKHTWNAIEAFLEASEGKRQPVVQLYERLMAPPLGLRSGPLPILLCAVMHHYRTEIALYENGSFIADWSMPVFERFLKAPQLFELKRFQMTGARSNLFSQFSKVFNPSTETQTPDLLTVVTPLMRTIAQLPKYTLTTQELGDNAKNLRKVVLNAREPDELLFKQLPAAFGFSDFGAEAATSTEAISEFFSVLRDALSELEQTYDILLNSVEQMLVVAFGLTPTAEKLRTELVTRAEPLLTVTIEMDLKGFLIQVCSGGHDHTGWLEAIATYLAKKPPSAWVDTDKVQFESNLAQLARKFRHFEAVSYEKLAHTESSTGEPIRVGITTPNRTEQERVVTLTPTADAQTAEMEDEIKKIFDKFDVDDNPELHIAILARISQKWMQQLDE